MSSLTKETLIKRVFSDPKNYPYGFSRSGDFSIAESRALSEHGSLIAALVDQHIAPIDAEDKQFLASALGQSDPQSIAERAWLKYQKRINRPKAGSIYGTARRPSDNNNDDDVLVDVEDGLGIELDDE